MYFDAEIAVPDLGALPAPAPVQATQPQLKTNLTVHGATLPPGGVAIRYFANGSPAATADVELYSLLEDRSKPGQPIETKRWMLLGSGTAGAQVPFTVQDLSSGSFYLRVISATAVGSLVPTFTI